MIEVFSRVFAKERPVGDEGRFKAYLYKTARHLALRHKQKRRLVFLRLDELDFEPQSDVLPETSLIHSERDRKLYAALEKLKAEYREALYLVYFEDMFTATISLRSSFASPLKNFKGFLWDANRMVGKLQALRAPNFENI